MAVLIKKGQTITPRKRLGERLDYPTKLVGVSNWKGSDGNPVTILYDPNTGARAWPSRSTSCRKSMTL